LREITFDSQSEINDDVKSLLEIDSLLKKKQLFLLERLKINNLKGNRGADREVILEYYFAEY
jgi:hypothetical protein